MKKSFAMKKLYYSISEVSRLTELEQYVLRYWESEFEQLRPAKNLSGNRIYTNKEIKLILLIKKLLREEKYTIEGARKYLKNFAVKEEEEARRSEEAESSRNYSGRQGELKLFSNEEPHTPDAQSKALKSDLKELRSFLNDLLKEI
ncbi:MAG: MerR family transcriptional regulator [Ignavibacteria bacterium]|nr:MerR family transcriptional regulator [Ignavibacteria bacterium]